MRVGLGTRRPPAAPRSGRRPSAARLVVPSLPLGSVDDAAARSLRGRRGVAARVPNVLGLFLPGHREA